MTRDWKTMPAREFCASVRDGTHDSPKPVEHGEFLITSRHIVGRQLDLKNAYQISKADFDAINRRSKVDQWDVLISMIGTVGEPCLVKTVPKFAIKNIGLFKSKGEDEGRWLFYYLQSPEAQDLIRQQSRGSTQQYIPLGALRDFPVSVPSDPRKMNAIAAVLGALDDKIEQNRRTAQVLEQLARAIFRAWFVDFEPVKAKAAGATAFPSMPQPVFDALPTRFVDSEIGPVPEGWEVKALGEVVQLTMGQSPRSEFYNQAGEGLPFHQGVSDHGFRFPTRRVYCTVESRIAEAGDILLSVRAPVGRINVADVKMVLGRGLAGMRHLSSRQSFLLYQMQHLFEEDDAVGDGTIYKSVNKKYLQAMPLITAPAGIEEEFDQFAQPMDQLLGSIIHESCKLAEVRNYLLPKLLSGKVRVEHADAALEETI